MALFQHNHESCAQEAVSTVTAQGSRFQAPMLATQSAIMKLCVSVEPAKPANAHDETRTPTCRSPFVGSLSR